MDSGSTTFLPYSEVSAFSDTAIGTLLTGNIHLLPCLGLDSPVLYSASKSGEKGKDLLIGRLTKALAGLDQLWTSDPDSFRYVIRKDNLGRPILFSGTTKGPPVSFSHIGGRTWAAMSCGIRIGIDAAEAEEFKCAYPFYRAFGRDEFNGAMDLCGGNHADAAALLWSIKEATVKAMGCGFHLFDPLEIVAGKFRPSHGGVLFNMYANVSIPVWTRREGRTWVSIAWIK